MPRDNHALRGTRRSSRAASWRSGTSISMLLLGVALGLLAAFAVFWLRHRFDRPAVYPPVAESSGQPLPPPAPSPAAALHPKSKAQAIEPGSPPFGISEDVFEAGAHLYRARCAVCHGLPHQVAVAHPTALQLWQPNHATGGAGVSKDEPAQIFHSIAAGQVAAGMPAYRGVLTSTQIWQLSLLLRNADTDLPDPVLHLLQKSRP